MSDNITVSKYWRFHLNKEFATIDDLKEGRTFEFSNGRLGCDECCNKDRCDEPSHYLRENCPYCLGSGKNKSCYQNLSTDLK